jgi:hypothetical protein
MLTFAISKWEKSETFLHEGHFPVICKAIQNSHYQKDKKYQTNVLRLDSCQTKSIETDAIVLLMLYPMQQMTQFSFHILNFICIL